MTKRHSMDQAALSPELCGDESGRMSDGLFPRCDHTAGCITCGDEAVEMRVIRIDHDRELALCEAGDPADRGRSAVEIALVQPVAEGDRLLVHAGTAIAHAEREVTA
jgi:hydrogenase maturation factor